MPSLLLALLAGCPDPGAAFDDYAGRVPDARALPEGCPDPTGPPLTPLPNLNGEALFALKLGFAGSAPPVQAIATITMNVTGATGEMDLSLKLIKQSDRTPGSAAPIMVNDILVSQEGQFCIDLGTLDIPNESNPLQTGDAKAEDVFLIGNIKSMDFSCGTATGMVTMPSMIPLTGSTFGMARIAPGTTGSGLPTPPVSACP
jgi:hypothetical protein